MTDLIEKAARDARIRDIVAEVVASGCFDAWETDGDFEPVVRAVLEAIRSPEDATLRRAVGHTDFMLSSAVGNASHDYIREMRLAWQAAIDHLLSNPNQEGGK